MTTWAHRPAVHPGDIVEADEDRHDAGHGRLILLVTAVGWRERRTDGVIWRNLRGVRIQPGALRIHPRPDPIRAADASGQHDPVTDLAGRVLQAATDLAARAGTRLDRCAVRVRLDEGSYWPGPVPGAAHLPGTPGWTCLACTAPWPCPTARAEVPLTFAGRRRALGAYLAACYQRACRDLPDVPSRQLYRRFLGWLSRGG